MLCNFIDWSCRWGETMSLRPPAYILAPLLLIFLTLILCKITEYHVSIGTSELKLIWDSQISSGASAPKWTMLHYQNFVCYQLIFRTDFLNCHMYLICKLKWCCITDVKIATRHVGAWWRYSSYSFKTSALDRGEWSASRPGRALTLGKDPRYPFYRRLGGPQSRSGHRG
jgi:hypothetical protein